MKINSITLQLLPLITVAALTLNHDACGQSASSAAPAKESKVEDKKIEDTSKATAASAQKPLPTDPEERFKLLFTKSYLSGRWAPLKDGVLGDERNGDKYQIVSVAKINGDNWIVSAKLKYRDQEFVMPIPVRMKFDGDTAILTVDELKIPSGGTYTARLLIYERTYSGTWKGQRGGGMLYGTITTETE